MTIEASDLMHATVRAAPFSDKGWLYEWKVDGFRCLVRKRSGRVDLVSRQGNSFNRSFPDVVQAVASVPGDFTWDAELTVGDARSKAAFDHLQQRARTSSAKSLPAAVRRHPARLFVFDMMESGDTDLREQPLNERKAWLRDSFDDTETLIYASGVVGVGVLVFQEVRKYGFEGMVAKRLSSPYRRGRTRDWLKIKNPDYERRAALGER
ncbi:ATP-dependent DNA ligase [Paraburkholderia flagellata]|uniref:ATP-dependent DNA ligase n=1 Tax=Paraburkholderia flagellata TaxID=2883241 RepID=UPI001F20A663|nr:DNA ligase [Paraburkholderia flagellata]